MQTVLKTDLIVFNVTVIFTNKKVNEYIPVNVLDKKYNWMYSFLSFKFKCIIFLKFNMLGDHTLMLVSIKHC